MPQYLPQGRGGWRNALPAWLAEHAAYAELVSRCPTAPRIVQVIADACDPPDAEGNLTPCFLAAADIAERARVNRATFWRVIRELISVGAVVLLARGGTVRVGRRGVNAQSTYGVPGRYGGLSHRAVQQERRVASTDGEGRRKFQVLQAGAQPSLWVERADVTSGTQAPASIPPVCPQTVGPDVRPAADNLKSLGVSHDATTPSRMTRLPPVASCDTTIPYTNRDGSKKPWVNGDGALLAKPAEKRRGKRCPHIAGPNVLGDDALLSELYVACVDVGLARATEHGRHQFWAAAECALRQGRDPCKLFASMVNGGDFIEGGSLWVTGHDEDAASARLKRRSYDEAPRADTRSWQERAYWDPEA